MLIIVTSRHYMDWETVKNEDGSVEHEVHSEDTTEIACGVYTSARSCAKAIVEFIEEFEADEDEREGPLEGFTLYLSELDKPMDAGIRIKGLNVVEDEDKVYEHIQAAMKRYT